MNQYEVLEFLKINRNGNTKFDKIGSQGKEASNELKVISILQIRLGKLFLNHKNLNFLQHFAKVLKC